MVTILIKRKPRKPKEARLAERLGSDYRAKRRMAKRETPKAKKVRVTVRVRRTSSNTPEGT